MPRAGAPTARRPGSLAGVAVAVVIAAVIVTVAGSGSQTRTVRAVFRSATNVIAGQQVRIAGVTVGHVSDASVTNGRAVITLAIDDPAAWPLRKGTVARVRFGTTVAVGGRYIELDLGPAAAAPLPDGATLGLASTVSPVEFEDFVGIFNGPARSSLRGLTREAGTAFGGHGPALAAGLKAAPPALTSAENLLATLGEDPTALRTLVDEGAVTASALAQRDPQLQSLITGAATTFNATAREATNLIATLQRLPGTLGVVRGGLARTDTTLAILSGLIDAVRPGARALQQAAPPATSAIDALDAVAPLASHVLATATRAAPPITSLLSTGTPFVSHLGSALAQAVPDLRCVLPYGPELAGFVSNWAGFSKNYGADGHVFNTLVIGAPIPTATPVDSQAALALVPGLSYAFPRPPGLNATAPGNTSQVWLQPSCGAGADTLVAADDPEAGR